MNSTINSNLNFCGKVYMGGCTNQDKECVAKNIAKIRSTEAQDEAINRLNALKSKLEKSTPDGDVFVVKFNHKKAEMADRSESLGVHIVRMDKEENQKTFVYSEVTPHEVNSQDLYPYGFQADEFMPAVNYLFNDVEGRVNRCIAERNETEAENKKIKNIFDRLA